MIRWFKTKRALVKELREYQTAFDALTASFKRHRTATAEARVAHKLIIDRLEREIEQMRTRLGFGIARPVSPSLSARLSARPLPADLADEIDQETTAKRLADGQGDPE